MKSLQLLKISHLTTHFILLPYLLIFQFRISHGSKFNPTVKIRKQELKPNSGASRLSSSSENHARKTDNCASAKCMPKPVPGPGNPECRPRYDGDNCCPTWICASDELLANSLFDENNNWNVLHDYDHKFDFDDEHDNFPTEEPLNEPMQPEVNNDEHNQNFINRMHNEDAGPDAGYKRKLLKRRRHHKHGVDI